jgi:hypothetical protein
MRESERETERECVCLRKRETEREGNTLNCQIAYAIKHLLYYTDSGSY